MFYLRPMSATLLLVLVTVAASLIAFSSEKWMNRLLLWPAVMTRPVQLYRLLTAGFVHADYMHLAFNMLTLYFFGDSLERAFREILPGSYATPAFVLLYLTGIIVSCIPSTLKQKKNPHYRSLGASGGVAAIVFAMIYLSPWSRIYLFFALGMPSILFAILYLGYTAYMARTGRGIVNHDAHLWGSLYGLVFMLLIDPSHGAWFLQALLHPVF